MSAFPRLICRSALRRNIVPLSLGLSGSLLVASRRAPVRFDAYAAGSPSSRPVSTDSSRPMLNSEIVKQLSSGSLTGFAAGLVVSLISKMLVLFVGLGITASHIASRYFGINVLDILKLRKRVDGSKILSQLNRNPVFKLSFGLTFALAAFTGF